MLTVVIFLLILIVMLLSAQLALTAVKAERKKEWIPIREQLEDRKIQKDRREAKRERSREATRNINLMTRVEEYDGNIR